MQASIHDRNALYTLIKRQQNHQATTIDAIDVQGTSYKGTKAVCEGWKEHFMKLAFPDKNNGFKGEYKQDTDWGLLSVTDFIRDEDIPEQKLTYLLIPVFKKKKAKTDQFGYRGITFTATIKNVLEILFRELVRPILAAQLVNFLVYLLGAKYLDHSQLSFHSFPMMLGRH